MSGGESYGPVWHSSASPVELFFRKQLHEQLHEQGREPCFCSFTMCLTLWEWVFREADQRVGQRVGCLAIEVVKLLMKLYQTDPMFLQLHHVLNSVRVSFQRSWPESWAESWLFGYWSCEAAHEVAHEAVPNGPIVVLWLNLWAQHTHNCLLAMCIY
jgi:hypothetical protein